MSDASRRDSGKSDASRRDSAEAAAATHRDGASRRRVVAGHVLWMFDFDNTLAPLEPAVDWAGSRRELQAWLAAQGVAQALFEEFPRGNLVLYEALRARLCAGGDAARAVLAGGVSAAGGGRSASSDSTLTDSAVSYSGLLDGASAIIERHELAGVGAVAPAPGAIELLHALRAAGGAVAIVTSNCSRTVEAWMRAREGYHLVDLIVGRDSGLALKPSPATVERALAVCAVAPADAAFVGDSEADLNAAKAAAVRFYGVNAKPEGRDRLVALGASPIFSSPSAMAIYLDLPAVQLDLPAIRAESGRHQTRGR
jgi:phosphoglycolate phosphatase-like HAD superfamily hydrolase